MLRTATAAICLSAAFCPAARAALAYFGAQRFVQTGGTILEPGPSFARLEIDTPGARQQSALLPESIGVLSSVNGSAERGLAVMKITFQLAEAAAWSATGSFSLLGESGFACVSLVNTAHQESLLLNEIAGDSPAAQLERQWTASGLLVPGMYILDAIIYTGGTGPAHTGSLEMHFRIPEPSALSLLTLAASIACRRSRQGTARTRVNPRSPLPAA